MTERSAREVRITDVAQAAGVSVGTVSNAMNRPHLLSPSTLERVQQAISSLGFVPNAAARHLREGAARTVGMIVLDLSNPFFTTMARGAEDRLSEAGLMMMLTSTDADPQRERAALAQLAEQRPRGILLTPAVSNGSLPRAVLDLVSRGTNVVLLDHHGDPATVSSVLVNDVAGAQAAVGLLLELGHRQIGFLNGPLELQQCADRLQGAQQAVVALEDACLVEHRLDSLDAPGGRRGVDALLELAPHTTALFCVNDLVALGAMTRLRERGVAIPQEVSVVGYDDLPWTAELAIPLTTVHRPMHSMGWQGADLLLGSPEPRQVVFTPRLVVRDSTAAAHHRR